MSRRCPAAAGLLALVALLAPGCQSEAVRPYESLPQVEQARRVADLIVEGKVRKTENTDTFAIGARTADGFASLSNDSVLKTRVTMDVTEVIKAPPDFRGPVEFWFYSPCLHTDPGVLLGWSLPPAMKGDRLRVFLIQREGEYWLLAHERWYAPPPEQARRVLIRTPTPRVIEVPVGEAGAAGATPGTAAAPAQPRPSTPSTTRPPSSSRLQPRDRRWPPPRTPVE